MQCSYLVRNRCSQWAAPEKSFAVAEGADGHHERGRLVFVDRGKGFSSLETAPIPPAPVECRPGSVDFEAKLEEARLRLEKVGRNEKAQEIPLSLGPAKPMLRIPSFQRQLKIILSEMRCREPAAEPPVEKKSEGLMALI
jgi:hypothetical protein